MLRQYLQITLSVHMIDDLWLISHIHPRLRCVSCDTRYIHLLSEQQAYIRMIKDIKCISSTALNFALLILVRSWAQLHESVLAGIVLSLGHFAFASEYHSLINGNTF